MSTTFDENAYEQAVMAILRDDLGYETACGYDIERDVHQPCDVETLSTALRRINRDVPESALVDAEHKILSLSDAVLLACNEQFMDWLQNGLTVSYQSSGETKYANVRLVDYDHVGNNTFRAINQWTVEEMSKKRCDIVVFVNGLPLVVCELKSALAEGADISDAYKQIRNYQQLVPRLFYYNAFSLISDMTHTKVGSLTASENRYMEWKTVNGDYESTAICDFSTPLLGIFQKERLLNILHNFICWNKDEGAMAKILTAYHQYYAVNRAVQRTWDAINGNGKVGVFWHTQGSGKSLSMVFYAHQLIQQIQGVTIIVVTDRNDLDQQLFGQFARCKDFLRQTPQQAESKADLREKLKGRQSGGIFFTTIQKFEDEDGEILSDRRNIVVMSDEAHRSQYGGEYWDANKERLMKGQSQKMRESLPNASYIGFTGTPISDRDRDTQEVFGDYIDVYDMTQAVADGATKPVYYESRLVKLELDEETLKALDDEFDKLADEGATEEQLRAAKQKSSRLEALLEKDVVINSLVDDILDHYENNRAQELTGKAMIVALTRGIGIKIYKRILQLRPTWGEKVHVVMSTGNQDPEEWAQIIGGDKQKKELARRFKDDNDEFKIAIVRDMWLTGFDVPSMATMYVFKPMRGHNLMQAIARVNRVFPEKEGGLIVDYIGIAQALKNAMKQYTKRDQMRFGDPDIAKTAHVKWQELMEVCRDQLHGFDYSGFFEEDDKKRSLAISGGVNYLFDPVREMEKSQFVEHSRLLHNATTLCRSMLSQRDRLEVTYMDAIRISLVRISGTGRVTARDINERISNLLRQSVKSEGVINLFGGTQQEFSLFDEAFMDQVMNMKEKNLAVELLKNLLKDVIRKSTRANVVLGERFSEMMNRALSNYLKGMLTNTEVIEELLKIAQQLKEEQERGNALNLNAEEKAFYDALSRPEGIRQAYSDEQFVALTRELTEQLRRNRTIDWNHKESARAKMRVMIKRLLKQYGYPPAGYDEALEMVMRQCDNWADDEENFREMDTEHRTVKFEASSTSMAMAAEEEPSGR